MHRAPRSSVKAVPWELEDHVDHPPASTPRAMRGASLVVWAIAEGREAARHVDSALRGGPLRLPVRGQDQPFG